MDHAHSMGKRCTSSAGGILNGLNEEVHPAERGIEAIRPQKTICACNLEAVNMKKEGERQL